MLLASAPPCLQIHGEHKTRLESSSRADQRPTNPAEAALKQEATKPQYSLTLLTIVSSDSFPVNARLSAALAFKNFIRLNYVVSFDAMRCNSAPPILSAPTRLRTQFPRY